MLRTLRAAACIIAVSSGLLGQSVKSVTSFGARGDGTTDDTAAISAAIQSLQTGETLSFPCGTYRVTGQLSFSKSNVTLAGTLGCTTIRASSTGFTVLTIGSQNLSSSTQLSASSAELARTFQADFAALGGLAVGDHVMLKQGGSQFSGTNVDGDGMMCSVSGCRSEILKIASVSGNTATVETALHYAYSTSLPDVSRPIVRKLLNPAANVTVRDLTLDGGGNGSGSGTSQALFVTNAVNFTGTNLTLTNVSGVALIGRFLYGATWNNVKMSHCAGNQSACFDVRRWGRLVINGMSITEINDVEHTFGFSPYEGADGIFNDVLVDKDRLPNGSYRTGRAAKYNATSYVTTNRMIVRNTPVTQPCCSAGGNAGNGDNGISIEYYSSHNTFNDCVITNNGANGIAGWGEGDTHNIFNNCTMSGNGIYQVAIHNNDHNWEFNGGTYAARSGNRAITVWSDSEVINNTSVQGVTFRGPGTIGLRLNGSDSCVNDNSFSGFAIIDVQLTGSNNVGTGNSTPNGATGLAAGVCGSVTERPQPPTNLSITIN